MHFILPAHSIAVYNVSKVFPKSISNPVTGDHFDREAGHQLLR